MKLRILISVFFLINSFGSLSARSKEDSLVLAFNICKVDSQKFSIAEKLITINIRKTNYDVAKRYGDTLLAISSRSRLKKHLCLAYSYRAAYFYKIGKNDSAISYNTKSISIAEGIDHYYSLIKSNINLGNIYIQKGDYKKAIVFFQKAEHFSDLSGDTLGKISTTLNLGNVFYAINDYAFAKKNFRKAIQMATLKKQAKSELSTAYNNLGTIFLNMVPKSTDSAMFYYQHFLEESVKLGDNSNIALAYYNIAEVLRLKKEPENAKKYYDKSKELFGSMEDTVNIAKVLLGMSDNYIQQGKNKDAISALNEGLIYAANYDMMNHLPEFYKLLSTAYYNTGKFQLAYDNYYRGVTISDSLYNAENSEIIYDLQTKYETNEKEKQNIILTSQNEISQKTIKQQKTTTFFIIIGLILTLITAFFILRSLRQQRSANKIISEQKREVEKQKSIVDEKQKEIVDSINYAKRIQDTLLVNKEFLDTNLHDNFVLLKPKDIVSGDFYWAAKVINDSNEELFFLACCDSTGHGVPGAFMSLLNIGFLSEAIKEKSIYSPDKILNYVRLRLVESISKEGQQDGFDGILLCINKTTGDISYAAANNAPVIISNSVLLQLTADKMPVGKGENLKNFSLQTINYVPGDILYLFTDGYADQFGGDKGKKFRYKPLNELLSSVSQKSFSEQKDILSNTFSKWKGPLEQVDDVLIIGIRI